MFTADVRFEAFPLEAWTRLLSLFQPRAPHAGGDEEQRRGGVIAVIDGSAVRKLLHTTRGRLPPPASLPALPSPSRSPALAVRALQELARLHDASWALSLHLGALDEAMERFGANLRRHHDLFDQAMLLASIVRELMEEGAITAWPPRLAAVPIPSGGIIRRALDTLTPDGKTALLGLFDQGELYTALLLRRRSGLFDLVAGPGELKPAMGVVSGEWRRDVRLLSHAAEQIYGPLAFGCFAEVARFKELQIDDAPGAWGQAVALREVVISPMPTGVGMALGVDAARLALKGLRSVTKRMDRWGIAEAVLRERDPASILGFHPVAVLRELLRR